MTRTITETVQAGLAAHTQGATVATLAQELGLFEKQVKTALKALKDAELATVNDEGIWQTGG
jgi:predicted ArsR family transcriptional regulator